VPLGVSSQWACLRHENSSGFRGMCEMHHLISQFVDIMFLHIIIITVSISSTNFRFGQIQ
jgi:hypothetical protein